MLPVYKWYGDVPLYLYPPTLDKLRAEIVKRYGSLKRAREYIRKQFKCYLSENAIWKRIVRVPVDEYEEPPVEPKLSLAVVMVRGARKDFNYIEYLMSKGLPVNPYSYAGEGECFGFYCKGDFTIIDRVVGELAMNKLIKGAIIVNAVWYARLNRRVNLARLSNTGLFVPSTSSFKMVSGVIETAKVAVFHTGTVRIVRALTPEQAREILGKVYAIMRRHGAIQ